MSQMDKPSDAFIPSGQVLQRAGAKIELHKVDDRLKGFEMVVCSSNNKAVENVSAELPGLHAVAADASELRYFKTISDNVLERETWGIAAAVLGNASNRYLFSQGFWRDEERGLSTYLNHASGLPQTVSEPQESGPPIKRNREIIDLEKPPQNKSEALARWKSTRANFSEKLTAFRRSQSRLQDRHVQLMRWSVIDGEIDAMVALQPALASELQALEIQVASSGESQRQAENELGAIQGRQAQHLQTRPGFLSRLFQTNRFKVWGTEKDKFFASIEKLQILTAERRNELEAIRAQLDRTRNQVSLTSAKLDELHAEKEHLRSELEVAQAGLGVPMPDAAFFSGTHEDIQKSSVWFDQAASIQRDDVFEAAMHLHRAFIDCAADQLRQNLSVFVETFGTRSLGNPQKDSIIADLWTSFFLVVPVVSTTFASVNRMFSRLKPGSLGWLLIDEAGQALPQAAVGAIMRTRQSVVVGDPLQIEPVVTLPNSLTEEICGYFGVDPLKYNAPEASAQTVADAASGYCARFPTKNGYRDVGSPLLVHRRCASPMFEISNEIAYSNLMVQAKTTSTKTPALGKSSWVNVVGKPGPDKWCADEATKLIDMLQELRGSGEAPDLYVVTPFVIVQDNLRQELVRSGVLDGWVDKPSQWVWEHVGTVHTVQGREAKTVFFVLGAQASSQTGARNWAGGRPNLVNVAVTRAKESLYVIGNRELWKSAGVFAALDRYLS